MKKWLFLAACLLTNSANAEFLSGNDLYSLYKASLRADNPSHSVKDYADAMEYLGYVTGVWDVADGIFVCTQEPVTRGQIADMVGKYLKDNPEVRSKAAASTIILQYLASKYPCKKN